MPTTYMVNHDFQAEAGEEGELSVKKGMIVISADGDGDGEGWIEVMLQNDKSKRGYVPETYLRRYTPISVNNATASSKAKQTSTFKKLNISPTTSPSSYSNIGSNSSNVMQMETAVPPANSTKLGPIRRLSDPRLPGYLEEVGGVPTTTAITKSSSSPSNLNQPKMPMPSQNINDEFSNLIALHDDWLKNMQESHQNAFRGMINAIDDLENRVASCQSKNTSIVQQMGQLDQMIDEEKTKWKQRLDSEKQAMTNRIANMYSNRPNDSFGNSNNNVNQDSQQQQYLNNN